MISQTALILVLSSSTVVLGITDFSCDTKRPVKGSDTTCKCITSHNLEWQLNRVLLSQCTTTGLCSPNPVGYVFQTDTSNPDKEYSLTVQGFGYSSCNLYSCKDLNTSANTDITLSIAAFNFTSPSVFVEPGKYQNGNIEITTECLFKESDIMVEWYYVTKKNATEKPYDPSARFQIPTNCTDTCNGEAAVKLNIGFNHTEDKSDSKLTVKFVLKVYHNEDPANFIYLKTNSEYKIKAPSGETPDEVIVYVAVAVPTCVCSVCGLLFYIFVKPWIIWKLSDIWSVIIIYDATGIWSHGASVGAVCVTEVTAGGPAHGKLKVGHHIHKINEETLTGKDPNHLKAMLKNTSELILHVSKDGRTDISRIELNYKKGNPLGFEAEHLAMVTDVIVGSKAHGKLKKGHRILSINGKSTTGKSIGDVNKELKNTPNIMELCINTADRKVFLHFNGQASTGIAIKKEEENIRVSKIESKSAAEISGEVQVGDCILRVNGVSTAGLKVAVIKKMLNFSVILKVTKDVPLLELDPDHNGSIGVKNASANTVISVKAKGPAALAGIQEEDEILKIDGKSTDTMTVKQIAKMIESREKTVIFESARGEVTVERDTNGSLGLELSSTPNVVYKVDGNAALSQKVKPGDTIVSINGKKTKGKSHQEIKTMLESSGGSISLKIKEAVTENGNSHRTSGHAEQGARRNDLEMGEVSTEASSSGRLQTLETTGEKHDFRKPRLGNIS